MPAAVYTHADQYNASGTCEQIAPVLEPSHLDIRAIVHSLDRDWLAAAREKSKYSAHSRAACGRILADLGGSFPHPPQ